MPTASIYPSILLINKYLAKKIIQTAQRSLAEGEVLRRKCPYLDKREWNGMNYVNVVVYFTLMEH